MRYLSVGYRKLLPEPQKSREPTFRSFSEMSYKEFVRASGYGTKFALDDEGDAARAEQDWRRREARI
jgi:hypothetical protein